ncbi:MAG TPA: hypothetical protein VKW78_18570 [Terriglobales bacterium]|nr:hypothetical protein [Terriglobales bacterium]
MRPVVNPIHTQILWNPFALVLFGVLNVLLIGLLLVAIGMT